MTYRCEQQSCTKPATHVAQRDSGSIHTFCPECFQWRIQWRTWWLLGYRITTPKGQALLVKRALLQ